MNNAKAITKSALKNPKFWGVATLVAVGYFVGDWRGVVRANKAAEALICAQKDNIDAYEGLTKTLTHRLSVQTLTLNAYDNLANSIAGGGSPDDALEHLFTELDFVNVIRTAL